jgi:ubiquinone/menaquinone biosynthesis C-methylase UbiE
MITLKRFMPFFRRRAQNDCAAQQPNAESASASIYPATDDSTLTDAFLSGWFRHETAELLEGFKISSQDTVLDVGSGDSPFLHFCAMQGAAVTFVDIDRDKARLMSERLKGSPAKSIAPIVGDASFLPLQGASMSKVIAMEVMEHVDDPHSFLKELVRVGRPGCQYLITVPDPVAENLQKQLAPDSYFQKPNHIRIISREEFKGYIEKAGLIIEHNKYYGFYWSIWWIFFWACKQDLSPPWHPLLESWTETWKRLLSIDEGRKIKKILDRFMPKSQAVIAKKPFA